MREIVMYDLLVRGAATPAAKTVAVSVRKLTCSPPCTTRAKLKVCVASTGNAVPNSPIPETKRAIRADPVDVGSSLKNVNRYNPVVGIVKRPVPASHVMPPATVTDGQGAFPIGHTTSDVVMFDPTACCVKLAPLAAAVMR